MTTLEIVLMSVSCVFGIVITCLVALAHSFKQQTKIMQDIMDNRLDYVDKLEKRLQEQKQNQ